MNEQIKNIVDCLNKKGISFAVSENYETKEVKIKGIKITKEDKFYRANGIIISGNMARALI